MIIYGSNHEKESAEPARPLYCYDTKNMAIKRNRTNKA